MHRIVFKKMKSIYQLKLILFIYLIFDNAKIKIFVSCVYFVLNNVSQGTVPTLRFGKCDPLNSELDIYIFYWDFCNRHDD